MRLIGFHGKNEIEKSEKCTKKQDSRREKRDLDFSLSLIIVMVPSLNGSLHTCKTAHHLPCSIISTKFLRWGKMAQPIRMAICCTIFIPVCLACHDFLLLHTAFKKGSSDGMPRADATTANALAVVLRTYSSKLSMSGRMVEIIVARPAAFAKLEMISRPSTRA